MPVSTVTIIVVWVVYEQNNTAGILYILAYPVCHTMWMLIKMTNQHYHQYTHWVIRCHQSQNPIIITCDHLKGQPTNFTYELWVIYHKEQYNVSVWKTKGNFLKFEKQPWWCLQAYLNYALTLEVFSRKAYITNWRYKVLKKRVLRRLNFWT